MRWHRRFGRLVSLAFLFSLLIASAKAQVERIELRVDGLACPFCAYGLEKNLKALKGVDQIDIDLDGGLATLIPKKGAHISLDRMTQAVQDAGFTPKETTLVATGRVVPLASLADDAEAMKAIDEIQDIAEKQGIDLPRDPAVLVIDTPRQFFLLLKAKGKKGEAAFAELTRLATMGGPVTVTGILPAVKKKAKRVPATLFVEAVTRVAVERS